MNLSDKDLLYKIQHRWLSPFFRPRCQTAQGLLPHRVDVLLCRKKGEYSNTKRKVMYYIIRNKLLMHGSMTKHLYQKKRDNHENNTHRPDY